MDSPRNSGGVQDSGFAAPAEAEEGTCFFPYWMMSMPELPEIKHVLCASIL